MKNDVFYQTIHLHVYT